MSVKKLLYVERDDLLRDVIPRMIFSAHKKTKQKDKLEIQCAESYDEGREKILEGIKFDVILLDMNLKSTLGTGVTLARLAREKGYQGRIVIFSGGSLNLAREETSDLENMGYILKPSQKEEIYQSLFS